MAEVDYVRVRISKQVRERVRRFGESIGLTDNAAIAVLAQRAVTEWEKEQKENGHDAQQQ